MFRSLASLITKISSAVCVLICRAKDALNIWMNCERLGVGNFKHAGKCLTTQIVLFISIGFGYTPGVFTAKPLVYCFTLSVLRDLIAEMKSSRLSRSSGKRFLCLGSSGSGSTDSKCFGSFAQATLYFLSLAKHRISEFLPQPEGPLKMSSGPVNDANFATLYLFTISSVSSDVGLYFSVKSSLPYSLTNFDTSVQSRFFETDAEFQELSIIPQILN